MDGGYIRKHLLDLGLSTEFNPWRLAQSLYYDTPSGAFKIDRVFYYDAIDWQSEGAAQQDAYLRRVGAIPFTRVATGYMREARRRPREQKAVDVQLAVDALEAALSGRFNVCVIFTGDGDFAPLLDAVRRAGPFVLVAAFPKSLSLELNEAADAVIELSEAQAATWLLDPP